MSRPGLTIQRDQPIAAAACKMERHTVARLVVAADQDESPIGVISASEVVRAMSVIPADEEGCEER